MNHTLQVVCFFEDIAHERFITALIKRAAEQQNVTPAIKVLNATHGSRMWKEFRQYLRELEAEVTPLPDVFIVVMDGNCQKATEVVRKIEDEVKKVSVTLPRLVCAVPDPHIERWYLEDQQAFKKVLPRAQPPKKLRYKCEHDRYKRALIEAIRAAGVEPLLGGAEYGEDIAKVLDPSRLDRSFKTFWRDLCSALREVEA